MRALAAALIVAFVLASSAFAGNIALTSLGATATCGGTGTQPCSLPGYGPLNAIDGIDNFTEWVAPGSAGAGVAPYVPWLMIDLNTLDTVDYVTVYGWGNIWPGDIEMRITYDLFVGTDPNAIDYLTGLYAPGTTGTEIATNITPFGNAGYPSIGGQWSDQFGVSTSAPIRYVFYQVVASQADQYGHTIAGGYDDAYTSEIVVDVPDTPPAPEPGTFGLLGAGLLALGLTWRSRRK
jgi:hypothetical protein